MSANVNLALQFVAAGILLVGLWQMGNRKLIGPALATIAEVLWVVAFVPNEIWGGVFLSVVLTIFQGRNFVKWYAERVPWF